MNNGIKESFGSIHAEEELKNSTREFLVRKTRGYTKAVRRKSRYHVCAAVCACLMFLLFGGRWLYFTPTAEISIDINPSIELSVNRFDRIIAVNGFNDAGREIMEALDIKHKTYTEAVGQIMDNEQVEALLSGNEIMTITVTGSDGKQSSKILSGLRACTNGHKNTHCYRASSEDASAAHEMGLSCGRYRAFQELVRLDPSITPEMVQDMTMREIQDLIDSLSEGSDNGNDDAGNVDDEPMNDSGGCGNGNRGNGNRGQHGHHGHHGSGGGN
ncbi:MAG: hypothetical protein HFG41_01100 [Coprococcus sp.]|nr:hypothetical protein [Coprococcus sp.]